MVFPFPSLKTKTSVGRNYKTIFILWLFNLQKNSSGESGLASAGVPHDEDVVPLDSEREPEPRHLTKEVLSESSLRQLEADAIGAIPAIELPRRDKLWPPQPSSLFPFASANGILGDGYQQAETEHAEASPQCR